MKESLSSPVYFRIAYIMQNLKNLQTTVKEQQYTYEEIISFFPASSIL